jgi:hypothetical protein
LRRLPDCSRDAAAARERSRARRLLELGILALAPDRRAPKALRAFVEQPEGAELPAELATKLLQNAPESVLDRLRFGESAADGVLNEEATVEFAVLSE